MNARPRRPAYTAPVAVAIEARMTELMADLEGIKAEHAMTDDQVAAATATAPNITQFWREWRRRQAPLTEPLPIVETDVSVGDINDL